MSLWFWAILWNSGKWQWYFNLWSCDTSYWSPIAFLNLVCEAPVIWNCEKRAPIKRRKKPTQNHNESQRCGNPQVLTSASRVKDALLIHTASVCGCVPATATRPVLTGGSAPDMPTASPPWSRSSWEPRNFMDFTQAYRAPTAVI